MHKKKAFFITFEGIEGSGKSYQSKILYKKLKKKNFLVELTREPGGTLGAEKIRNLILKDYFHKNKREQFDKYTDTLLYLAARNEHVLNKIKPILAKKKIIICDRFIDSTLAYQVYGKKVNKKLIDTVHSFILRNAIPDLTFLLKVDINKAMKRINNRKSKNRYDKFSKKFYKSVQNAFLKIAKKNRNKYIIVDNSVDGRDVETLILNKFYSKFSK